MNNTIAFDTPAGAVLLADRAVLFAWPMSTIRVFAPHPGVPSLHQPARLELPSWKPYHWFSSGAKPIRVHFLTLALWPLVLSAIAVTVWLFRAHRRGLDWEGRPRSRRMIRLAKWILTAVCGLSVALLLGLAASRANDAWVCSRISSSYFRTLIVELEEGVPVVLVGSRFVHGIWRLHLWLPLVVFGFPIAVLRWHDRRTPHSRCVRCGYNLTGLTINRCPECGAEFDGSAQHSWKERDQISEVNP